MLGQLLKINIRVKVVEEAGRLTYRTLAFNPLAL